MGQEIVHIHNKERVPLCLEEREASLRLWPVVHNSVGRFDAHEANCKKCIELHNEFLGEKRALAMSMLRLKFFGREV